LTLQLPFPAPFRRQGANLIPPQQHNPNISDRINLAILKGMELNSENRSPSIPAWLELLKGSAVSNRSRPGNPQSPGFTPSIAPLNPISARPPRNTTPPSSRTRPPNSAPPVNTSAPTLHPIQSISLISIAGVDYAPLQELLSQAKFKEADQETARMLLKLANREKAGWLDKIHVDNLPCEDLRTIDQLWQQGSNGRFGFSSQRRIYKAIGGTSDHNVDNWKLYCDRIGWRQNNKMLSYNPHSARSNQFLNNFIILTA
jgi:eukaryotic-like serine/threonine-protein kinase